MNSTLTEHCFTTVQHVGKPTGERIDISVDGTLVPTYLAMPRNGGADGSPQKVILYFADVFGPFYVNNQLIQDYFAVHGFIVLGIDYFFGDTYASHEKEPGFDRPSWIGKCVEQAQRFTPGWIEAVKQMYDGAEYFAVGYCFGAPYAVNQAKSDLLSAVAVVHPSRLELESVVESRAPILFSCAETDNSFKPELRRAIEDALSSKKMTYHFQLFSGVKHGFASRGDPSVEVERWAKEECARSIVRWFMRFSTE